MSLDPLYCVKSGYSGGKCAFYVLSVGVNVMVYTLLLSQAAIGL